MNRFKKNAVIILFCSAIASLIIGIGCNNLTMSNNSAGSNSGGMSCHQQQTEMPTPTCTPIMDGNMMGGAVH